MGANIGHSAQPSDCGVPYINVKKTNDVEELKVTNPIVVKKNKSIVELLDNMKDTGFQGKRLALSFSIIKAMIEDKNTTVILGYSGSLSTTGQWKIINWLMENNYIDILVPTGANISEDIIEAMGFNYYQCPEKYDDTVLFKNGYNRYYNVLGREDNYLEMTELIAEFILTLDRDYSYSSREFLYQFGLWLQERKINCIVTTAAKNNIPIFCPAIVDSPYGDAALIAKSKGFNLSIDSVKDYVEFMSLAEFVKDTGVIYLGGGVPKDFIQLFSVTADLLFENRKIPNRNNYLVSFVSDIICCNSRGPYLPVNPLTKVISISVILALPLIHTLS